MKKKAQKRRRKRKPADKREMWFRNCSQASGELINVPINHLRAQLLLSGTHTLDIPLRLDGTKFRITRYLK